jgi:hypothetical protein
MYIVKLIGAQKVEFKKIVVVEWYFFEPCKVLNT